MPEHLSIKADNTSDWIKKKLPRVIRTLTPRESDQGRKSSWAHTPQEHDSPSDPLVPEIATCKLHALAMFMFGELHSPPGAPRRMQISGVSVFRSAVPSHLVDQDYQPHPIPGYEQFHRSLLLGDRATLESVAQGILDQGAFSEWWFSRDQLADLLKALLDGNHIAPGMERDARSLLAQWST